jgi:uncharacterized DUF497 family protein
VYAGQRFRWDPAKALANFAKHGIRFEQACEVFFDPFVRILDTTADEQSRDAALGLAEDWALLFVVDIAREEKFIRIISAREATRAERRIYEDES